MKANAIYWLIGLGIILSFLMPSCNSSRKIDPNAIMMDTITNYYVFKENGEKVTGIVEEKSKMYGIQDSVTLRRVFKEGILIESNVFYADGKVYLKGYFDPQKINFINKMEQFTPEGDLVLVEEYDLLGRNVKRIRYYGSDSTEISLSNYTNNYVTIPISEALGKTYMPLFRDNSTNAIDTAGNVTVRATLGGEIRMGCYDTSSTNAMIHISAVTSKGFEFVNWTTLDGIELDGYTMETIEIPLSLVSDKTIIANFQKFNNSNVNDDVNN